MADNTFSVTMPDGTVINGVPEGTTKSQLMARYNKYSAPAEEEETPKEEPTLSGEFKKGMKQAGGLAERAIMDYAPGYIAGALGFDEYAKKQFSDAANRLKEDSIPAEAPAVPDLASIKSPYDAALFASAQLGQGAAQLGANIAGATVGGMAGTAAAGPVGGVVGAAAGGMAPAIPMNAADITDSFIQAGLNPNEHKALIALTTGAVSGLDIIPGLKLASKFTGVAKDIEKTVAKNAVIRLAKAGYKTGKEEGFTEALQQVLQDNSVNVAAGKPLGIDINSTLTAAFGGALSGGAAGAVVEAIPTPKKVAKKTEPEFKPEEEVVLPPEEDVTPPAAPVVEEPTTPTAPEEVKPVETVPIASESEDTLPDGRPVPPTPTEAPPSVKIPKPKGKVAAIADEIRLEMKRTETPVAKLEQEKQPEKPKFNFFSNLKDENTKNYVKDALDLVGMDEDVMLVNLEDMNDDSWIPLSVAHRWVDTDGNKGVKSLLKDSDTDETFGLSATVSKDLAKPVHFIGINPSRIDTPSKLVRTLAHETGHIIFNRFIERDPKVKQEFVDDWKKDLKARGADVQGLSDRDIALGFSSWSFNNMGQYKYDELVGMPPRTRIMRPQMKGQSAKTTRGYKTAFDEYMAEHIARWYQSDEKPLSSLDKFFKTIADMYRKFVDIAVKHGLMPKDSVQKFMDDLVLKAKGARVAEEYREDPLGGIQQLKAYHGSPYRFSQFTTEKIGEGEGYQAFGWGLYFTSSKDIADFYKKKLSGEDKTRTMYNNGEYFSHKDMLEYFIDVGHIERDEQLGNYKDWRRIGEALDQLRYAQGKYDIAIENAESDIKNAQEEFKDFYEHVASYLRIMQKKGFEMRSGKGATYEVQIPEEDEMLDWDKHKLDGKYPEGLVKVLRAQYPAATEKEFNQALQVWTGEYIYSALIDSEGSPKEASQFLNGIGIKGIKYKAGQISNINSKATNYVIFDDAAIQINQIYDDETLLAKLIGQSENQQSDELDTESPFTGYRPNPKVTEILTKPYSGLNNRVLSVLRAFANNINKTQLTARSNAVQQYLLMSDALNDSTTDQTLFPEIYRGYIKNATAVPDTIRNVMNNDQYMLKMLEGLRSYYKLTKGDMKKFGVAEMQGEAYKLYRMRNRLKGTASDEYKKLDSFVASLPTNIINAFKFMDSLKNQIKMDLNTQAGILNNKDLVQGLSNETTPSTDSLMNEINQIRDQAKKETLEDRGLGEAFALEEKLPLGDKKNNIGWGWLGRNIAIPRFVARYSPAFAMVKNAADERREAITGFRHLLFEGARDYFTLPNNQADYIGSILDEQRRLKRKATINPNTGFLEFQRKNKDGKIENVTLKDAELSRIYKNMQDISMSIPLIHKSQLKRSFAPLFAKANLGFDPSKEQFNRYAEALKKGNVKSDNALSAAQMGEVEQYFDTLDSIDKMLQRDYIPHMRFGTRGGAIKNKSGKVVWFGNYMADNNGKPEADSYQEYMDDLNKFRKENPEYANLPDPDEFDLTIDNISRQLGSNNKALTLELLAQLMNSSNSKLFKEAEERIGKLTPEDLVKGKISNRGFMRHMEKTDEDAPQGYSKDWKRVWSAYFNSAAYFLGNMENEPRLLVANSKLQNQSNASKNLKDYSQKYVNDILDPEENYTGLRELQYVYAMGFNPSSALLQLQSLFTYMPATLNMATGSMYESVSNLTKATKIVPLFFDQELRGVAKTHESLFAYGNAKRHEELIQRGKITRTQSDIIKSLYNKGVLQALRSGDMIGVPSDVSTRGTKGKWRQRRNDLVAGAGIMMRTAEEATRGIQALGAILSLDSPDNVMRLHNNLMQNDAMYRNKINESFSKEPDVNYLVQFLIDKSLGEYGKEARAPIQNTFASVSLIPFSTYPWQMLLNTYEILSGKYGKEGKLGALWALSMTALAGGMKAIPAALFIKELIEYLIQRILGEDRDLEEELKKWAAQKRVPDVVTGIATNGIFSELLGIDVSSRMAVDVPFGTEFLKYLQGEQPMGVSDVLGVQGTVAEIPAKMIEMAMKEASLSDILAANIPLVSLQNAIKAKENTEGVTYRGMPSLTPESGSELKNIAKRALGFKPLEQGMAEKTINELRREEVRYKIALDRYRSPLKNAFKKELLAKNEKEREKAAADKQRIIGEMIAFMQKKGLPNIGQSVRSVLQGAQLEAYGQMQGLEGGAVRKMLNNSARQHFDEIYGAY